MDPFDLRNWPGFEKAGGDTSQPAIVDQVVIDSRRISSPNALFVALKGSTHDGHDFIAHAANEGACYAIVSGDYPTHNHPNLICLRVPRPLEALQSLAQCYRKTLPAKIIGITGSFGKTMVKDLLLALLSSRFCAAGSPESFNSQIGVPLSLLSLRREHEIAIIEAAISEEGEMDRLAAMIQPDHVILTPVGKKHLATLGDINILQKELSKLLLKTGENGWKLVPTGYSTTNFNIYFWDQPFKNLPHATPHLSLKQHFSLSFPNHPTFEGPITGIPRYFCNLLNMSIKAAWLCGVDAVSICNTLLNYRPEAMRTEFWKTPSGLSVINDTYCSDPQSIQRAIQFFSQANQPHRKIFLFGGLQSQSPHLRKEFKQIGKTMSNAGLDQVHLYGNHPFEPLIEELRTNSPTTTINRFETLVEALNALKSKSQPDDCVLIKGEKKIPLDTLQQYLNEGLANNQCFINLAAIQTNISLIKRCLAPKTRLMGVVKAFAYGTNDIKVAQFLISCSISILGVSYVDEAIVLRRAGIQHDLFSIHAAAYEVEKVVNWNLEVGASDLPFLEKLESTAVQHGKKVKVHLHVNTGMGRFGCRPEEAMMLANFIANSQHLVFEGLMTHFSCADDPAQDQFTRQQAQQFDQIIDQLNQANRLPPWLHASNSSAAIRFGFPQYNMVRIGLAIYGLHASGAVQDKLDLRLALSLSSRVTALMQCHSGESISYGRNYHVTKEKQKIAVLPMGYFDGLHRHYSGKGYVLIRGQPAPMVGNICMDYMMVDVTEISDVAVGDPVLIFGEDEFGHYLCPEELASKGNSIIHELITCLGPRIPRIFIYEEGQQIR